MPKYRKKPVVIDMTVEFNVRGEIIREVGLDAVDIEIEEWEQLIQEHPNLVVPPPNRKPHIGDARIVKDDVILGFISYDKVKHRLNVEFDLTQGGRLVSDVARRLRAESHNVRFIVE